MRHHTFDESNYATCHCCGEITLGLLPPVKCPNQNCPTHNGDRFLKTKLSTHDGGFYKESLAIKYHVCLICGDPLLDGETSKCVHEVCPTEDRY